MVDRKKLILSAQTSFNIKLKLKVMKKRAIPLVDLSKFTHGTPEQQQEFVKELGTAFHEIGFVGVVNHGIPKQLIDDF